MAITEFDLDKIDELIANEEATLEPKHAESIAYRAIADRHVAGGVASSWQDSPPHAIFVAEPGPSSQELQTLAAAVVDEFEAKV